MTRTLVALLGLTAAFPVRATFAQSTSNEVAVRQTVLNYVEGLYEGDVEKVKASVHKDMRKTGFLISEDGSEYVRERTDRGDLETYARAVLAGGAFSADADKEIVVLDVQNQTALAKLTAIWGTEYVILAKEEGQWVVMTVVWEAPRQ